MTRTFPLIRSFNNLVWNIRHFQHPHRRPAFKATRHPFCTNQQLRDASCTFWLKETTKDFGQKLKERRKANPSSAHLSHFSKAPVALAATAGSSQEQTPRNLHHEFSLAEKKIIQLYQDADYMTMYETIKSFHDEGVDVSKDIIVEIISSVYEDPPMDTSINYILQSTVEQPLFFVKYSLRLLGRYANFSSHIKHLYEIATLYEKKLSGDESVNDSFLKTYIWLCYHLEDLPTLQRLLYQYLQSATYDTRTLSYIINSFTYSYDVEYAKSLFINIIGMGRPLDEALLSSTLFAFIRVQALYDNISEIYKCWSSATNCDSPYPKTVAMLANQTYIYGTEKEIAAVEDTIQSLGYENNFLILMTQMQTAIVLKDTNKKKIITQDELKSILEVRNTLGRTRHALKVYYESYIRFFSIHSDMNMVQFILKEMKKDGIPLSRYCYEMISTHYVSEAKFFNLFQFMKKFVIKYNDFDLFFVRQIFQAFIKTYPHYAEIFSSNFDHWVQQSSHLSSRDKSVLREECKVSKLNTGLNPYKNSPSELKNDNKYSSSDWSTLKLSAGKSKLKPHLKRLTQYAEEEGIKNLMRRGIRPNYYFIEDLLRKLNNRDRSKILSLLPNIRMTRTVTRLKIYHFVMNYPKKDQYSLFYHRIREEMNTSDKLLLARRTLNSHDYETTTEILDSIGSADMTDSRQMLLLNLRLRNNLGKNNLSGCAEDLKSFALDKITLSPYIYTQCKYIEKEVCKKIKAFDKVQQILGENTSQTTNIENLKDFLHSLRGFIGDIQVRLKKDQIDIQGLIKETFQLLSQWAESRKTQDERKV